jgi:hypothetical protein
MNEISFSDTLVEINISKSKTDIYRRGNKVVIAKTGNKLCPVNFLIKYIEATNLTAVETSPLLRLCKPYKDSS